MFYAMGGRPLAPAQRRTVKTERSSPLTAYPCDWPSTSERSSRASTVAEIQV